MNRANPYSDNSVAPCQGYQPDKHASIAHGECATVTEAQAAAESAALALLCEAAAALAPTDSEYVSRVMEHDDTFGLSVEAHNLESDGRAQLLGCALIAAAAARKETP